MSKSGLPPVISNPKLAQVDQDSLGSTYDVVIAKKEHYVTPSGLKKKTVVFSRTTLDRINADKTGELEKAATCAKSLVTGAIMKLKKTPTEKARLLTTMDMRIKGNIPTSSSKYFSADSAYTARTLLGAPMVKMVRFVDAENALIADRPLSAAPPVTQVILPEFPPDHE